MRRLLRSPSMILTHPRCFLTALCLGSAFAMPLHADTVLETETAELGKKWDMLISMSTQFEKDKDGNRTAFTLTQYEVGLTDRAEILIEPFFVEWDNPKTGKSFHGMGDLEITPSYMIVLEKPYVPAIVLAFKLKVPTARNRDIGTGKYDYYPYLIFGKKIGHWIFNANFGYDFITSPRGDKLSNQFIYDLSVEREITDKWSVYAEVFANTKPTVGEKGTFSGAIATEYKFNEHFNAFVSVGYDTDQLFNVRPGFNIPF